MCSVHPFKNGPHCFSKMVLIIPLLANADLYLSWSSLGRMHPDKHHLEELTPQGISATGIPGPRHHWSSCWGKPRQPAMLLMALIGTSGLAVWICTKLVYLSAYMSEVTSSDTCSELSLRILLWNHLTCKNDPVTLDRSGSVKGRIMKVPSPVLLP